MTEDSHITLDTKAVQERPKPPAGRARPSRRIVERNLPIESPVQSIVNQNKNKQASNSSYCSLLATILSGPAAAGATALITSNPVTITGAAVLTPLAVMTMKSLHSGTENQDQKSTKRAKLQ